MPRLFALPQELRESGILGINRRNLSYILEQNPRRLYPRVDDKLQTKAICEEASIPVPTTYTVIQSHSEIRKFKETIAEKQDFVIKPARGAAGRGVLVVVAHDGSECRTPSGRTIRWSEARYHVSTILSGLHSLGGRADRAIVEQRVVTHPALDAVAIGGTPDVRVILYLGVPVMAMVRLPTSGSGGRANLHQGAIAAAVDLLTGVTYGGVCRDRVVSVHPDTGAAIAGIELPDWRLLIDSAMRLGDALGLGYLGVDYMIDAARGPVVLEANARPGLAIQVAHRRGLLPRLHMISRAYPELREGDRRWELIAELANERVGVT